MNATLAVPVDTMPYNASDVAPIVGGSDDTFAASRAGAC
jgi:hypothetical protein